MSAHVTIMVGDLRFTARLDFERCPRSCELFLAHLPLAGKLIQGRWSGEAAWWPLGGTPIGDALLGSSPRMLEHATSHPAPDELLLYPGGLSEPEILFLYGRSAFGCRDGPLEGNPFLMITEGRERLAELGRRVVWEGAQEIRVQRLDAHATN